MKCRLQLLRCGLIFICGFGDWLFADYEVLVCRWNCLLMYEFWLEHFSLGVSEFAWALCGLNLISAFVLPAN